MRRFRSLFKLSFVMLVIFLLIFKLKNSDVRAEDTSGLNVEIYNNNSWVENNKYMYHYDMVITNEGDEDVNGWEMSVRIPGENIQVTCEWNIHCVVNGDVIVITPKEEYFKHISSGQSINNMGLIISSDTEIVDGNAGSYTVTEDRHKPPKPSTEPPMETPTEPPTELVTDPITEAPTEPVTEPTTEAPTEPITETPTTEAPTEPVTEPATEVPIEPTTEQTTEAVTESPTDEPTEDKPEGAVEIRRDGKYYLHIGTTYYLAPGQWMCSREDNECIAQGGNVFYIRVDGTYEFTIIEE